MKKKKPANSVINDLKRLREKEWDGIRHDWSGVGPGEVMGKGIFKIGTSGLKNKECRVKPTGRDLKRHNE